MQFSHDPAMRAEFPQLAVATLTLDGVTDSADVTATAAQFLERASARLAERPESEFPEIAAWRRAFSQMGLKPTQYRCASEALLRRFKKDGELPSIHRKQARSGHLPRGIYGGGCRSHARIAGVSSPRAWPGIPSVSRNDGSILHDVELGHGFVVAFAQEQGR